MRTDMLAWMVAVTSAFALAPCGWADDGPAVAAPAAPALAEAAAEPPPPAVLAPHYLRMLAVHLYGWYLDEEDLALDRDGDDETLVYWVRRLLPALDEGDGSEWAEVRMPQFGLGVKLKRPDYAIEELGVEVRSEHFRIVNVCRLDPAEALPSASDGWVRVEDGLQDVLDDIHEAMRHVEFPGPALSERLRVACREAMGLDPALREPGDQVMHISFLSPVANEVWVFVENQCLMLRFSSDSDIEAERLWPSQRLDVRMFDIRDDTVVTLDEAPGSNVVMTRDQIGRALFNCLVYGKRLVVVNPDDPGGTALHFEHVPDFPARWE